MDSAAENAEIVRRIASQDAGARDAEAELCRRFAPRAQLYGRKHLRNVDGARDLAQAAMLAVIVAARAGRITDGERLDRFVLGTCRNIANRMREVDARAEPIDPTKWGGIVVPPSSVEAMDSAALFRCFRALGARDRTVVQLSFHEEKSAEEIALVVETTAGNVRVLRHRAVAQMRRCLDGEGA